MAIITWILRVPWKTGEHWVHCSKSGTHTAFSEKGVAVRSPNGTEKQSEYKEKGTGAITVKLQIVVSKMCIYLP